MEKIKITPTPSADSRTAIGDVSKEDLKIASMIHIMDVIKLITFFSEQLNAQGVNHDTTKLTDIEQFFEDFSQYLSGEEFEQMPWWLDSHRYERHHFLGDNTPVPEDINLIDFIEHIADIVAAAIARAGEFDWDWTMENETRLKELLWNAYRNTILLMLKNVELKENDDENSNYENNGYKPV